jgi:hypothetical protein
MALKAMRAPDGADEALRRGILEMAAAGALEKDLASVAATESPLRVFTLPATALGSNAPLKEAQHAAWRYTLLDQRNEPIAFAEVAVGERGALRLAQVGGAAAARAAHDALAAAENSALARSSSCEARLLRFPTAYLTAIWLATGSDDDRDVLVPVAPAPDGVERHRAYGVAALIDAVKPTVDKQLGLKVSRTRA